MTTPLHIALLARPGVGYAACGHSTGDAPSLPAKPMAQTEEYYAVLKYRGIPLRLLRFNGEYHGTGTRPSNAMRTILYMDAWHSQWARRNGEAVER